MALQYTNNPSRRYSVRVLLNRRYYSIYLVGSIIFACFLFMFISTVSVLNTIGGKTSADLALEKAKQTCLKKQGELVQVNKDNPLNTVCIVNGVKSDSKN